MRKILQITFLFSSLILSGWAGDLYAQTENRQKSRLDIRPKTSTVVAPKVKFSLLRIQPNTGLDRSLSLKSNSDFINRYFKTALFSTPIKTPARTVAEVTTPIPTVNSERSIDDRNNEDKLFANDRIVVSTIYPNPADDFAEVEYSLASTVNDAKLTFYNVIGLEVKAIDLPKDEKKVRISTRDMNSGVYLYQLSADGKSLVTKKMFIKH